MLEQYDPPLSAKSQRRCQCYHLSFGGSKVLSHCAITKIKLLRICLAEQTKNSDIDSLWGRKQFEPFGTLKTSFRAAKEAMPADTVLNMSDPMNGGDLGTADSGYEFPKAQDMEIFYICFDVIHDGSEVRCST